MVVVPIVGNAVQFWITDSILQKKDWTERDKVILRQYFVSQTNEASDFESPKNEAKLSPMTSSDELHDVSETQLDESREVSLESQDFALHSTPLDSSDLN